MFITRGPCCIFLDRPKAGFANYWMSTGGQSTLWWQFFKDHSLRDPAEFQQLKRLIDFLLALNDEDSLLSHGASPVISSMGSCC